MEARSPGWASRRSRRPSGARPRRTTRRSPRGRRGVPSSSFSFGISVRRCAPACLLYTFRASRSGVGRTGTRARGGRVLSCCERLSDHPVRGGSAPTCCSRHSCQDGAMSLTFRALDHSVVLWSVPPDQRAGRPLLVLIPWLRADERDLFSLHAAPARRVRRRRGACSAHAPWPSPGYYLVPDRGHRQLQSSQRRRMPHPSPSHRWMHSRDAPSMGCSASQGGAITVQALRMEPGAFAFVINLSGYATPGPAADRCRAGQPCVRPSSGAPARMTTSFVGAGRARRHRCPSTSTSAGASCPGLGHSISGQELADVQTFLAKQLEAGSAWPSRSWTARRTTSTWTSSSSTVRRIGVNPLAKRLPGRTGSWC